MQDGGVQKLLPCRVVTFLYHEVTDDPNATGFQRVSALPYKHPIREFEKNIDVIAKQGMTAQRIDQIDLASPGDVLMMTFDDGGRSARQIADILDQRGWRGHFLITTKYIGSRYFVDVQDIRDLHSRGHVIGSHSHSHPDVFNSLSLATMREEWKTSCAILSDIIQAPVVTASVPGGDMNENTCISAGEAGVRFLFTSEPTFRPWKIGPVTCVGRVYPLRGTPLRIVSGYAQFSGFRRAMAKRRVKNACKVLLGPLYRRMMANNVHRGDS